MANTAAMGSCRFLWNILNPFVPFETTRAAFYHRSPTLTKWTVTLVPLYREKSIWFFSISLHCSGPREEDEIVLADRIGVNISLNGRAIETKVALNYHFWRTNRHTYQFQTNAVIHLKDRDNQLNIEVDISFNSQNIPNQGGNGLEFDGNSILQLSQDLMRLLIFPNFHDLEVRTRNPNSIFNVHTCIMACRWSNFFSKHGITDGVVDTNMTTFIVNGILLYLYSGIIDANWLLDVTIGIPFMSELFRVIDYYKLYHLYKVFTWADSRQVRTTKKHQNISIHNFRVDDDFGRPLSTPSFSWGVDEDPIYGFTLEIKFFLLEDRPRFFYHLKSHSPFTIHAQVNLEFRRRSVGQRYKDISMHEKDYRIKPRASEYSGICYFEENCSDFNDFIAGKRHFRKGHFVRCILCLSHGALDVQVQSEGGSGLQDDWERLNVLSDHMHALLTESSEKDFRVLCPTLEQHYVFSLHKSIFTTRVPQWRNVLARTVDENIPDEVELRISSTAFDYVLTYIYTGKAFLIPPVFFDEIETFAVEGGMIALRNLVYQMRFFS